MNAYMEMLSRTRIVTRLFVGFALILSAALVLGIIGASSIERLASLTADGFRHPFAVSIAIREAMTEVHVARQVMSTLVRHADLDQIARYEQKLLGQRAIVDKKLVLVRERYLGNPLDVDRIERALAEWRAARAETTALVRSGRRPDAIALNNGHDDRLVEVVLERMNVVADAAAGRAAGYKQNAEEVGRSAVNMMVVLLGLILVAGTALTTLVTRSVRQSLAHAAAQVAQVIERSAEKARVAEAIGAGDLTRVIAVSEPLQVNLRAWPDDEMGALIKAAVHLSEVQGTLDESFRKMTASLRHGREAEQAADWLKSGLNELGIVMRGEQGTTELADKALTYLAKYLRAGVGALYLFDEHADELQLAASYAFTRRKHLGERFALGEGLIGQAARERKTICLSNVPPDYLPIGSALGESVPTVITAVPLLQGDRLVGALEIGAFREFADAELEFLELAREGIAIGLGVNQSRQRMAELLEETQQQAEELRVQQEELQQSNEELEERAQVLEQQREDIRAKNRAIEVASENLRQKAAELERVSSFKSEFLANMSHELRTPLNSLMILSRLLTENKDGNLSDKQVQFASTIHSAGSDLLNLINDILDLSKVEAGQLQFRREEVAVPDLCHALQALFMPLAEQKGLAFDVAAEADVPASFEADEQRVHQIMKNLLSNAVKFTETGRVALRIGAPTGRDNPLPVPAIAFAVSDTGIGICPAQQQAIFQAFQQADGSISRKYGGTGLGLSISLQLARRMQGDIRLVSTEGEGSVFTLYLPLAAARDDADMPHAAPALPRPLSRAAAPDRAESEEALPLQAPFADDRARLGADAKSILIIEDDLAFARVLEEMIRERGFAVLAAADGESGVALAERHLPSAVILDVMLPRCDGWSVMRRLKDNPRTRHIPVHFITCLEDRLKALGMGAIGFVTKPADLEQLDEVFRAIEGALAKSLRRLLIVEDDRNEANSMVALLEERDVEITVAATGHEAIALLGARAFDCLVLDLGLADMSGFELLEHIQGMDRARRTPVIIHSGRDLTYEDERKLRRFAESIIIKGAKSPERLLNEVTLFLHLVESNLHPNKQRMIRSALDKEAMLEGRKVLLVDDDMRNVFSLSSVLGEKHMTVIEAENGSEALARLDEHPDVSIVLMDIMMPETDGYTAMREIRKNARFANLPVIAMTAKALKGDYEKCMAAGASDYISKPIEVEKLLSLIRVWIYQHSQA
jgi:hypothetical protein